MNFKTDQKRYRVTWENGYAGGDEPWRYMEIKGQRGMIHPWSKTQLVCLIKPGLIGIKIQRSKNWRLLRDTDDGREFLIDNQELSVFSELIMAYKRRIPTQKQLNQIKKNTQKHRFKRKGTE